MVQSAAGRAWATLPPRVATLRTCGPAIRLQASVNAWAWARTRGSSTMRLTGSAAPTKSSSPRTSSRVISAMEVTSTRVWTGACLPCSRSSNRSVPPAMGRTGPGASAKAFSACDRLVGRKYSCQRFIGGTSFFGGGTFRWDATQPNAADAMYIQRPPNRWNDIVLLNSVYKVARQLFKDLTDYSVRSVYSLWQLDLDTTDFDPFDGVRRQFPDIVRKGIVGV